MPPAVRSSTVASPATNEPPELQRYREAFNMFDKDGSGALSVEEIKAVLMRPGGGAPISDAEAAALIAESDTNRDGELQFEEFAAMWGCDVQGVPSDSNMMGGVKADLRHIEPAAGLVGLLLALVKSSTRGAGLLYLRGGGPVNDSLGTAEV